MAKWNPPEVVKEKFKEFKKNRQLMRELVEEERNARKLDPHFLAFHNRKPPRNRALQRYFTAHPEGKAMLDAAYQQMLEKEKEQGNEVE